MKNATILAAALAALTCAAAPIDRAFAPIWHEQTGRTGGGDGILGRTFRFPEAAVGDYLRPRGRVVAC